jgi:hypothetical protein
MYTDGFPEDMRIVLTDSNGSTIWDERLGNNSTANQLFDWDICLNPFDCYNFTLYDSALFSDGLTKSPVGGRPGRFNLTLGSNMVGAYDGATDGCFSSYWFIFGEMCRPTVIKARMAGKDTDCSVARAMPEPVSPSRVPSLEPSHSSEPSAAPSATPSTVPSLAPSRWRSSSPSAVSSNTPSIVRSLAPSPAPSEEPSSAQSAAPSIVPSIVPSLAPSRAPSAAPSLSSSIGPSHAPSATPSLAPSIVPSLGPSKSQKKASQKDTKKASKKASLEPSLTPSFPLIQHANVPKQQAEACKNLELELLHDEFPEDLTIVLESETGEKIWDLSSWAPSQAGEVYSNVTCLDATLCYRIEFHDKFADGLTRPMGSGTGSFTLMYDDKLVGSYNGSSCFSKMWFQFGANCTQEDGMEGGSCKKIQADSASQGKEDCYSFVFSVQLDKFPEDVSLFLATNDQVIWKNERPWGPQHAGQRFEQGECLSDGCYKFSVIDQYNDGLTKPVNGSSEGSFNVTYKGELIGSYDATEDECYSLIWFEFGSGCKAFPQSLAVGEVMTEGDCRDERRR